MRRLWPIALLLALACRSHVQDEGDYTFTVAPADIIRDDCGLVAGGLTWTGKLSISGDYLRIQTDVLGMLHGIADPTAQVQLIGQYRLREENFVADGSSGNVSATVASGQECLVDLVNVHLEAASGDPTHFTGTLRVSYETRVNNGCTCQAWVSFSAVHQ